MTSIQQRSNKTFDIMVGVLDELDDFLTRKLRTIKNSLYFEAFDQLERSLKFGWMMNLTNYKATNSDKREQVLEDAFELMKFLFQFEYNKDGSFTKQGAADALKEDVKIIRSTNRRKIVISGKLKDLEYGINSWDNMRRYFYRKETKIGVYKYFDDENTFRNFYSKLDMLFNKDTERGRPYISQAITVNSVTMGDVVVRDKIAAAFNYRGQWVRR